MVQKDSSYRIATNSETVSLLLREFIKDDRVLVYPGHTFDYLCHLLVEQNADVICVDTLQIPYPLKNTLKILSIGEFLVGKNQHTFALLSMSESLLIPIGWDDIRKRWGEVVIAGFGPGDPGLVTRRTEAHLHTADVVFYDDLLDAGYLMKFCASKVYVGKRKGQHSFLQSEINELIYQSAISGKKVVRLKGGDPLIFGRGSEEFHYLNRRFIRVSIVPGVSSAMAAAAHTHVPLTARGVSSSVAFLSGHDLDKLRIPQVDTLVFYMGASNQRELAILLMAEGWHRKTPVVVVRNASRQDVQSRQYTLEDLCEDTDPLPGPVIITVGYVAAYDANLQPPRWLYTGDRLSDFCEDGVPVHSPMIRVDPLSDSETIRSMLTDINRFHRIVFASDHSVRVFFSRLYDLNMDCRDLSRIRISPLSPAASHELCNHGIRELPVLEDELYGYFANSSNSRSFPHETILFPCSEECESNVPEGLTQRGNTVVKLPLFRLLCPLNLIRHNLDEFYGVVFTSPKEIDHFLKFYGSIPSHLEVKTIGLPLKTSLTHSSHRQSSVVI